MEASSSFKIEPDTPDSMTDDPEFMSFGNFEQIKPRKPVFQKPLPEPREPREPREPPQEAAFRTFAQKLAGPKREGILCHVCNRRLQPSNYTQALGRLKPLIEHVKIHLNNRKYQCSECSYLAKTYVCASIHVRRMHESTGGGHVIDNTDEEFLYEVFEMAKIAFPEHAAEFETYFEQNKRAWFTAIQIKKRQATNPEGEETVKQALKKKYNESPEGMALNEILKKSLEADSSLGDFEKTFLHLTQTQDGHPNSMNNRGEMEEEEDSSGLTSTMDAIQMLFGNFQEEAPANDEPSAQQATVFDPKAETKPELITIRTKLEAPVSPPPQKKQRLSDILMGLGLPDVPPQLPQPAMNHDMTIGEVKKLHQLLVDKEKRLVATRRTLVMARSAEKAAEMRVKELEEENRRLLKMLSIQGMERERLIETVDELKTRVITLAGAVDS
ncbi:unnamed protein product, partial [Mesorhabditis spiculigera]